MYSRENIISQLERYFNLLEKVDKEIDEAGEEKDFGLLKKYFFLTSKVRPKILDMVDSIRCDLDFIENKA